MDPIRFQIVLELLLKVLYSENGPRMPLVLIGWNAQQSALLGKTIFTKGVPVHVIWNDSNIVDNILDQFDLKVLLNVEALRNNKTIQNLAENKLFSTKRQYFFVGTDLLDFKDRIRTCPIFLNSAIKFVKLPYENSTKIKIFSVRNLAQPFGGPFRFLAESEFEWSNGKLLKSTKRATVEHNDWPKLTLPLGIVSKHCRNSSVTVTDAFMHWYTSEADITKDASPRLGYMIFEAIQHALKFKSSIICQDKWSVSSNSGGVIGDLVSNKTVICSSPMLALENRVQIIEVLYPIFHFRSTFTFQTPLISDLSGNAFLSPFSLTLWLCILCTVLIAAIIIRQSMYFEMRETDGSFIPSLPLTILSSFGALCQQGMTLIFNWNTSRILQCTFFLFSFVLFNYYTSLVVSNLISFPKPTKITSLKALSESHLELGGEDTSYLHYFLKESKLDYIQNIYKKMKNQKRYLFEPDEGVALAKEPGFAYHCEASVTLKEMMSTYDLFEMCNYHDVPLIKEPIYIYSGKHFEMGEFFKIQFMNAFEVGVGSKAISLFGEPKPACLANAIIKEVDLKYVGPVLLLLIYAMVLSVIVLMGEIIYAKITKMVWHPN